MKIIGNETTFTNIVLNNTYSGKPPVDKLPNIICHLHVKNNKITDIISRKWVNNNSQIKIVKSFSKIHTDSIYFPGTERQKLMTNENIFYGLSSFTLSLWVKLPLNYNSFSTFIEVIPKEILLNSYMMNNDNETTQLMSIYKSETLNKLNIGIIIDGSSQIINIDKNKINVCLNKKDWNNIIIVYQNPKFSYYINGNKIIDENLNFNFSSLPKNYITVIGGDCLSDLKLSKPCHMYINDLILYDGILFEYGKETINVPSYESINIKNFTNILKVNINRKVTQLDIQRKNYYTINTSLSRQIKSLKQSKANTDYKSLKYKNQKFIIGQDN